MKIVFAFPVLLIYLMMNSCKNNTTPFSNANNLRGLADTVGFAHLDWQMDSVMNRINDLFRKQLASAVQPKETVWKAAICPHDDYAYASWLYPAVIKNVKAKTVIIFGVAHKAKNLGLENQLVFDSFKEWRGTYGKVKVSSLREKIMKILPEDMYVVNDSMQQVEHSVEALIPFLQYRNRNVELVSILVPYMSLLRMDSIATHLSAAIHSVAFENNLSWGDDFALLISTDAVHYGDEEWGGQNYAPYGTDSAGYKQAMAHEHEILDNCFNSELSDEKAERFYHYTVQDSDFREYKWTWCGRYSVPMGLKTAAKLQALRKMQPLNGTVLGYQTTIDHSMLPVTDLEMGTTAMANMHHWVGFASVGFK
ncbi:MAG TPA: AmmeMemoRadiSam system protein B [Draconibacterium sp.]|nr:AmmeMemoRadiSam system protein B [Draconibacterium sp.]